MVLVHDLKFFVLSSICPILWPFSRSLKRRIGKAIFVRPPLSLFLSLPQPPFYSDFYGLQGTSYSMPVCLATGEPYLAVFPLLYWNVQILPEKTVKGSSSWQNTDTHNILHIKMFFEPRSR